MFRYLRLLLPLLLIALPWVIYPLAQRADPVQERLLEGLPLLMALCALLLASGFKRGRIALASVALGCSALLLGAASDRGLDNPDAYVLFSGISLLLPLVYAWLLIPRDSAILSRRGLLQWGGLLLPFGLLLLAWQYPQQLALWLPRLPSAFLEVVAEHSMLTRAIFWLSLPILALYLVLTLTRRTIDEVAMFGSLLAQLLALHTMKEPLLGMLFLASAGLLCVCAVVMHIYAMAFVDTLTGVPARRALEHHLSNLGRHYSIAMLDIDHFKQFNDTYGHDVGDQVLRMVAAQLNKVTAGGSLFRYGGEEFTIVFRGQREEEVVSALDTVRQRVADYPMKVRAPQRPRNDRRGRKTREETGAATEQVKVSISIGVAWRLADEKPDSVIKRADKALYKAKGAGRNRVITEGINDPRRQRRVKDR
ncbi:GGDEF domain-containing protein [Marinobacterium lutimaris]|uniref:diguanylate cyclase n=1 Tax=Marinobacterium lutimaris TaxID=568106 RepID=A0A1H5UK41_9GAMM|nr:GGDEF domain-containing protein [Marinobacterium lutimaris]SEF74838.1 diguanylate cyclase (GGDEF) domain-containing protein [Marinobacterium lutimaris]